MYCVRILCDGPHRADSAKLDSKGFAPLHLALIFKETKLDTIEALLDGGGDPDLKTRDGRPPLTLLLETTERTKNEKAQIVALLIQKGADPLLDDKHGRIAMLTAAMAGDFDFCAPLFDTLDLSRPHDRRNLLALICASALGRLDVVSTLIEAGVPAEQRLPNNWRAVAAAAMRGQTEVVKRLLAYGAPVNWASGTPSGLTCAAECGSLEIIEFLLAAGASPNAPGSGGRTPLYFAVAHNQIDIARRLFAAGAFVDSRTDNGATAMHIAAREGRLELGEVLLAAGADLHVIDKYGDTPLHDAAANGKAEFVTWLLDKGVSSAEVRNENGRRPADLAKDVATTLAFQDHGISLGPDRPRESSRATFLAWAPPEPPTLAPMRRLISAKLKDEVLEPSLAGEDIVYAPLPFYDEANLLAVPILGASPPNEIFFIVSLKYDHVARLDWTNEPIYMSNEILNLNIKGEAGTAYLYFFFFFVRGQLGRFNIVEKASDLDWLRPPDHGERADIDAILRPVTRLEKTPLGMDGWTLTCAFKNAIFRTDAYVATRALRHTWHEDSEPSEFSIGQIQLRNEQLLKEDLEIRIDGPPSQFG